MLSLVPRFSTWRYPRPQLRRLQISINRAYLAPAHGLREAAAALWSRRQILIERQLLSTGQTDGRTDTRPLHRPCTAYYAVSVNKPFWVLCTAGDSTRSARRLPHLLLHHWSVKKVKVGHTRLPSIGFRRWSRFLAVSLQVAWVINPAVDCHYFPPGLQLPSQPLRGLLPVSLLGEQRHDGCEQFA